MTYKRNLHCCRETANGLVTIQNSGLSPWWFGNHELMSEMSTQRKGKYSFSVCEGPYRMIIMNIDSEVRQPGFDDGSAIY